MFISLGFNCYSAQLLVNSGLRITKNEGYKTCPFDLMFTFYESLCELIKNDFEDFYNPNFLELIEGEGDKRIVHKKYNCIFNHESPDHYNILGSGENWTNKYHFTENNYKNFIERYKNRVYNFKNYIQEALEKNEEINFLICRYNRIPIELDEIISLKYPNLKYKILYIPHIQPEVEIYQLKYLGLKDDNIEFERFNNITNLTETIGNCIRYN